MVDIEITPLRQFQCAPTTYVNSINNCIHHKRFFFHKLLQLLFMFHSNEYVEMNKFLCSLASTRMTIIDSKFYIIYTDSLVLNWWLPGCKRIV